MTSIGPRFERRGASVLGNYQRLPSISSLVFLRSLCVSLTWGHIRYALSEGNNPIVISNPIFNLQNVVLRYKWQQQQEKKINKYYQAFSFFPLLKAISLLIYWPTNAFMLLNISVHNRRHLGHVVRVLASAHQEFQEFREVLDPRDLPEIMDLKDPQPIPAKRR